MQQLAGPLGLLNPLFLQQVAAYGNYTQVSFQNYCHQICALDIINGERVDEIASVWMHSQIHLILRHLTETVRQLRNCIRIKHLIIEWQSVDLNMLVQTKRLEPNGLELFVCLQYCMFKQTYNISISRYWSRGLCWLLIFYNFFCLFRRCFNTKRLWVLHRAHT